MTVLPNRHYYFLAYFSNKGTNMTQDFFSPFGVGLKDVFKLKLNSAYITGSVPTLVIGNEPLLA